MTGETTYEELQQRVEDLEKQVHEQGHAKKLLERSNIQLLDIFESISDGFFSVDEKFVITYFNKAAERLLARQSWQVLGQNLFEAFPQMKGSIFEEKYTQGINEKTPLLFETYFDVKPYENWYEVKVYPQEDGISVYFQVTTERKLTEEALRKREELFRNVYDTAPLAFVVWDLDTRVTDWNKKAEKVFGWSKDEVIGSDFFDFLIPDKDRPQVENIVDRLLKGKLPSQSVNDNLTKGGKIITCEWNNSLLHGDDANIVGAISLALDITQRKQAEEALLDREDTLKSIFRAAPTGIGMVSSRVLTRVNDRICEMTGYSRDELVGQSARMLYPTDEDFDYVGREKYAQIREKGTGSVETRWKRKDGKVINVLLSSTSIDPSDPTADVTFTALDITEAKKAEKELRESEDRYRRITEAITDYIYTVTVQDRCPVETTHGPACVAVTGYTAKHFKENPYLWIQMVHEQDREAVQEQASRTLSGEKVPALEHRIIRRDGATRWVRNTPVLNFDSQGRLLSYDGLVQDITERKQAEEALRKANDELERFNLELEKKVQERTEELRHKNEQLVEAERLAALGKMANRVAHDLRNPLTAVGGFARRVNERLPNDDPNKKYLQMIVEEVITMECKVSEITTI